MRLELLQNISGREDKTDWDREVSLDWKDADNGAASALTNLTASVIMIASGHVRLK
jgi:hypothetical protein